MKEIKTLKAIKDILKAGSPVDSTNMCAVTETGRYTWDRRDEADLLTRARRIDKEKRVTGNGEKFQKMMKFLEDEPEIIQALFDIRYIMNTQSKDVQEACKILWKNKKELPCWVKREYVSPYVPGPLCYRMNNEAQREIEPYISLLDYLPPAWLKDIEKY